MGQEFIEIKDRVDILQRQVMVIEDINKTLTKVSSDVVNF